MPAPRVHRFRLDLADLDLTVLPESAREMGSPAFREAVKAFVDTQFAAWGGWRTINIGDREMEVVWTPDGEPPDQLDQIVAKLQAGEYAGAITLLQFLLNDQPNDVGVLYNLGMALSDVGRLSEAERHLRKAAALAPSSPNIHVALGVALARQDRNQDALPVLTRAVESDPTNPWAHRNRAAVLLKLGQAEDALAGFTLAAELNPEDQQAWFGLASLYEQLGRTQDADSALVRVIEINEHTPVADAARQRRSKRAHETFRGAAQGVARMDAVFYCLGALKKFGEMPRSDVERIVAEIGLMGMGGLDVNDSSPKYRLQSLPGEYSGLHLMCLMYTGFQLIDPTVNVGFDLAREYELAQGLLGPKPPSSVH